MMRSSNACVTDDDESVTISNEHDATIETETDVVSKDDAVEPQLQLTSAPFHDGEKVLAYHKGLIYEAKVLEIDHKRKRFYVHYLGWNSKWDEWLDIDRVMKHNQENLEKQKDLEKHISLENITKFKPKNPNETRGRKRKTMTKNNSSYEEKVIDVQIPQPLIKHLVDYCEYITHTGKLIKLPCSPNVDDILKQYMEHQSNKDLETCKEMVNGLISYFDKALPAMLLYKSERQQFQEATIKQIPPSKIYGAQHLLRLFVKLPDILDQANIEEDTLTELKLNLQDFLKFLLKKQSLFFLSTYETPDGSCTID